MPSAVFSLPGSILFLKVLKPGAKKNRLSLRHAPSLKRRRSGSCCRSGSVSVRRPFLITPGEKPNLHYLLPGGVLGRRRRCGFLPPAGRAFVGWCRGSGSACRVPENRKPGAAFPETAPIPLSFPAASSRSKNSRRPCVLVGRCPAALSPRPCFFRGSRLPMCSPTGRTLSRRVGHSPTPEKNCRPAAARSFFSRSPKKPSSRGLTNLLHGVIISSWLIPANPTAFAEQEEYNYIIPELQKIRSYKP